MNEIELFSDKNIKKRIDEYLIRQQLYAHTDVVVTGISTGISGLDTVTQGIQKTDLWIVQGRTGIGKCVAKGTKVITPWGYTNIEDLHPARTPDTFWKLDVPIVTPNALQKATHFYSGGKQKTFKVITQWGYNIEGTPEHPLLVLRPNGKIEFIQIQELTPDDYLCVMRNIKIFGSLAIPDAYILGILIGDGCFRPNAIGLTSMDKEIVHQFRIWAKSHKEKIVVYHKKLNKAKDYYIYSLELCNYLMSLGMYSALASQKTVPTNIWKADEESIKLFLRGLFDTDGWCEKSGYIGYSSVSEKLVEEIQLLLLKFGIIAKRTDKKRKHGLVITGENAWSFYHKIKFNVKRKQKGYSFLSQKYNPNLDTIPYWYKLITKKNYVPKRWLKGISYKTLATIIQHQNKNSTAYRYIKYYYEHNFDPNIKWMLYNCPLWNKVEKIIPSESEVFDVTVPNGHAFVANGIVSHNSWLVCFLAGHMRDKGYKVLVINREMDPTRVLGRTDALAAHFSYARWRSGKLTPEELSKYMSLQKNLETCSGRIDVVPPLKKFSISDIKNIAFSHKPDVIIVDYLNRMSSETGNGDIFSTIRYIADGLKDIAYHHNIPVIAVAQTNRAAVLNKELAPGTEYIFGGDILGWNADVVLSLYQTHKMIQEYQMGLYMAKHRDGEMVQIILNWNITEGMISVNKVDSVRESPEDDNERI